MEFYSSASFFLALVVVLVPAAVLGLAERRIKWWGLAASCVMLAFLFSSSRLALAFFCAFLAIASAGTFALLRSWRSGKKNLVLYRVVLAATLAPLVIYKVTASLDVPNLMGFIGISYITFKAIQVEIEIRDGLIAAMAPSDYLYFLLFFPTFTSGPIDRSRRFVADVERTPSRAEYADLLTRGILLLLVGAVMQLVIATIIQRFYLGPAAEAAVAGALPNLKSLGIKPPLRGIVKAYAYGLYLFFDFAGYSCMAMGASYCLGVRTPRNFRAPFAAVDLLDFWNRWHITLSTWLRDFVFMRFTRVASKRHLLRPLAGGERASRANERLATACAGYLLNMGLMGMWHGLTADYLAYGVYHGILLAVTEVYQKRCPLHKRFRNALWYRALSWFVTLNLVMIGFALFSGQAHKILGRMIHG